MRRAALFALTFLLGASAGWVTRPGSATRTVNGISREIRIYPTLDDDGVPKSQRLRVVRYAPHDGSDAIQVSAGRGSKLWRFVFDDHTLYAELVTP